MRCDRGAAPRRAANTAGYLLNERRKCMSVKVKVSYTDEQELMRVIIRLKPIIKTCKISKQQQGAYKKAYLVLKE